MKAVTGAQSPDPEARTYPYINELGAWKVGVGVGKYPWIESRVLIRPARNRRALNGSANCWRHMIRYRILVVDDEPNLSELVRLILEQTNRFEVRVENRSALALDAAREFHPDMILLDVDMPGKNGGEVARQIKAEPALGTVPILFLTSLVSKSEAGESQIVLGGMHYLAKPVSSTALIHAVDEALTGHIFAN